MERIKFGDVFIALGKGKYYYGAALEGDMLSAGATLRSEHLGTRTGRRLTHPQMLRGAERTTRQEVQKRITMLLSYITVGGSFQLPIP